MVLRTAALQLVYVILFFAVPINDAEPLRRVGFVFAVF